MNDLIKETLNKAINTYGRDLQCTIALEEMGELIQAICKFQRTDNLNTYAKTWDVEQRASQVSQEIADVQIMIWQLMLMFGEDNIETHIEQKLDRLRGRLGE